METMAKSIILIVDNDTQSRNHLESLLSALGHPVLAAQNGEEALEIAARVSPDLIILDIVFSDMNGFELCRRFRNEKQTLLTPIIILTALNDKDSRIQGITAGCDDFLIKPFDNLELVLRVGSLLKMKYYRDQITEKEKFELAMKHASEAMIITDEEGRIEEWNEVADRFFSLERQDAYHKNLFELFQAYFKMEPDIAWQQLPYSFPITFKLQRLESKQGEELILMGKMFLMYLSTKQERGYFVALKDVSRRLREEKRKDQFIHLISHKFRSACTIFMGSLSLLEQLEEENFSEEALQLFQTLQVGSQRIYQIFNRILEITEILSHKETVRPRPTSAEEIQKSIYAIGANLGIKNTFLSWENFGQDLFVPLEKRYLEMVLLEILENIVKYCPKETLKITVSFLRHPPGYKELKIQDNGPGIPQEELERLGERFTQIEKGFSGNLPGLGLGLFLVHEIIEQVGGQVRIRSAPGEGLQVALVFPE